MKKLPVSSFLALAFILNTSAQVPDLINYQGRLVDGTNLVSADVEMVLRLYNAEVVGTLEYEDSNTVAIVDGLYSTFIGDDTLSGSLAAALTNPAVYLEVEVDGTTLTPRERLASVSYALVAGGVTNGAITEAMLANQSVTASKLDADAVTSEAIMNGSVSNVDLAVDSVTTDKIADGEIQAVDVDAVSFSNTFWKTDGNAGIIEGTHFMGTTDDRPMDIRVNNMRIMKLNYTNFNGYDTFNIVGGHPSNAIVGGVASVIGGGGISFDPNIIYDDVSVIGGGAGNVAGVNDSSDQDFVIIGGGESNQGIEDYAVIGGGKTNVVARRYGIIGGGRNNRVLDDYGIISGGQDNTVSGEYSTVVGGYNNSITGHYAIVLGGRDNEANGNGSLAAGRHAKAGHPGTFVWADDNSADFISTSSNQFLVRAAGGVGINEDAPLAGLHVDGNVIMGTGLNASLSETNNMLNIMAGITTNGAQNGITFWENTSGFGMSLGYDGTGSGDKNALYFYNSDYEPFMRFENGGNVGIGVDDATSIFDVFGGSNGTPVMTVQGEAETSLTLSGPGIYLSAGNGGPGVGLGAAGSGGPVEINAGDSGSGGIIASGGRVSIRGGVGLGVGFGGDALLSGGAAFFPGDVILAVTTNGTPMGKVGIGTDVPAANLHIMGSTTLAKLLLTPDTGGSGDNSEIFLAEDDDATYGMSAIYDGDENQLKFFGYNSGITNGPHMVIARDTGQIGMGTTSLAGDYVLSVGGAIRAEEVVVETGWADYVFEEDYDLPSLTDVESSINTHGHLPDVPPASEIQADGVSLGSMQTLMMQKIEELTLYTIQQQKEIEHLRSEIWKLKEVRSHE